MDLRRVSLSSAWVRRIHNRTSKRRTPAVPPNNGACSSVGQSSRLIIDWSPVQVRPGPPPSLHPSSRRVRNSHPWRTERSGASFRPSPCAIGRWPSDARHATSDASRSTPSVSRPCIRISLESDAPPRNLTSQIGRVSFCGSVNYDRAAPKFRLHLIAIGMWTRPAAEHRQSGRMEEAIRRGRQNAGVWHGIYRCQRAGCNAGIHRCGICRSAFWRVYRGSDRAGRPVPGQQGRTIECKNVAAARSAGRFDRLSARGSAAARH